MSDQTAGAVRPVELRLLGEPQLWVRGALVPAPKRGLRLLAVLAVDGPQPRLGLADRLWTGESGRSLHSLRSLLHTLRRLLGPDAEVLRARGDFLELDRSRVDTDVLRLTSAELALEGTRREFMAGHRSDGPEAWLEWAEAAEARLLTPGPLPPADEGEGQRRVFLAERRALERGQEARWAASQGQPDLARTAALGALEASDRGEGVALALDVLIHQAIERDDYALALRYCQKALRATPLPHPDLCYTAGYLADLLGDPVGAERLTLLGLARLPAATSPALWYATVASSYDSRRDFRTARLWHELALQAARAHPLPLQHCGVLTFFLWHLNATGDSARAQILAAEALEQGEFNSTAYARQSLGIAHLRLGELDDALETLAVNCTHPTPSLAVIAGSVTARLRFRLGERDQALACLDTLLPLALGTEDGRARFEWAVAALSCAPARYLAQAQACVRGAVTNDPLIVAQYHRLVSGLVR